MGVPGFIPGVLDFSLWKTREALENKVAKENKPRMFSKKKQKTLLLDIKMNGGEKTI